MSASIPDALRARFKKLVEEELSGRAAALRLKLSPTTGTRWGLAIRRAGQEMAAPQGRLRGKVKLDPYRALLIVLIDKNGEMTRPKLADATGVQAHPDAISRFLRKLGFTYKKDTGRDRTTPCKGKQTAQGLRLPTVSARPERVVFIDETSVKANLIRQRGWSQRGERLIMDAPFGSWGTQTFIAGLSPEAQIAAWVIKGALDGAAFTAYVEQV